VSRRIGLIPATAGIALACAVGLFLGSRLTGVPDDAAFGRKVRAYILAHPEVVAEAGERLRIGPYRKAIETPFAGAWAGNPQGDVTLVMFTDYNCPYCRASVPEVDRLLSHDPKLKVVWRELPVLGAASDAAAAAALAAARQGGYPAFHRALFSGAHPDGQAIAAAAKAAGLVPEAVVAGGKASEVQAEIASNLSLARQLGISGTPFFVIGGRTFEGAIGYDALAAAVAEARRPKY